MRLLSWKLGVAGLYGVAAAVAALVVPRSTTQSEVRLGELAAAVLSADYRGDRPQLARLEAKLGGIDAGALNDYRDYWRGFALWRRAMNGFNVKPAPDDLDPACDLFPAWWGVRLGEIAD